MPKTRVLISQLLVPFKKTSSLVSGALGGVGLLAGLRKIVELDVNQLLAGLLSFYDSNVRVPVKWILDQTGIALPPLAPDILLVFVLFGIACTRSLLSVYEPTKDGYVVKGVWGLLSRWIFSFSKGSPNAVTWAIYQVLAVVLWPVIALEYCVRFKYVWRRYMDNNHTPDFEAHIGTFTSRAENLPELLYNQQLGYDSPTDT